MAQTTQRYFHILNELIDTNVDLVRMVRRQVQIQFEFMQPNETVPTAPPPPPRPPLTQDPFGVIKELGRSIRQTVALADKLENPHLRASNRPANPRPAQHRPSLRDRDDLSQLSDAEIRAEISKMSDAEIRDWLEALERERAEEGPAEHDQAERALNRPIADIIAGLCRDLGIAQLHDGHPWKQRFLTELTALVTQAAVQNHAAQSLDEPAAENSQRV